MQRVRSFRVPGVLAVLLPAAVLSQGQPVRPALRLDVRLVLIPVTVTGPRGDPWPDLPHQAFHLYEEGVEQKIRYFSSEDAPVSVGVVFDSSGSMESRIGASREAVKRFFDASLPGDEFFLLEFNDVPRMLCPFTLSPLDVQSALLHLRPQGWTSLFDAVYLGIHQMKRARNSRRALLILSDGADNNSRYTEGEIRGLVRESDVGIYSIAILGSGLTRRGRRVLENLAEESGGRTTTASNAKDLPGAVALMGATLRSQYVLGYSSANAFADGKYRKVEVRVDPQPASPPLRASWRTGYYAPAGR